MLIAVISDSHGNSNSISKVKEYIEKADALLFLGDGENDIKEIAKGFKGEVYTVKGNCDISNNSPEERIVEISGKRIFMCHGHRYGVKYGYNSIYYRGKELNVDIVVFGHSHIPMIEEYDGLILMNPGSISHCQHRLMKTLGYIELLEGKAPITYIKEM